MAWTNASGSILTSPPFHDFRFVQSGWRWRLHLRWWVLKNRRVEPADLTPDDPDVMSCILIGNWIKEMFSLRVVKWKARNNCFPNFTKFSYRQNKTAKSFFSSKTEHCCYSGVIIIRLKRLLDNLDTKPTKKVKNKEGIKKRDWIFPNQKLNTPNIKIFFYLFKMISAGV